MTRPLVTVVTPTWGRPRTILERAIPSIAAQTYRPLQHIIVTDGFDEDLNATLRAAGYTEDGQERRLVQLGRNWTGFSGDGGLGAIPKLVGSYLAAGEYICYLDDDTEYTPDAVEVMAGELERSGAEFVTVQWRYAGSGSVGGGEPPGVGMTDTSSFLHRVSALRHGSWQPDGYEADGKIVARWSASGCSWSFLPAPVVIYHGARHGAPDEAG